jgi:hypothetical protein
MSTAAYYREEAKQCRERAAASPGFEAAKQWLRFAADHDRVADLLESHGDTQSPAQHGPTHQQPTPQQQTKQEPEDKE